MSENKRSARKPLEVTVMFEPSRLATEHLIDAYRQLVPLRQRKSLPPPSSAPDAPTIPAKRTRS